MRNTRLYIIISVVVLIIIAIIATILSNQLKKGNETLNKDQSANKIETSGIRALSRTEKNREVARITKQSNTSLLSDDQVKRLNALSEEVSSGQGGIITGENFDIGYSNITNLFCVQKKTPQADVEFTNYLTEKNALDIYEKDPSLFAITDVNCSEYLKKQEEYIVQDLDLDETFPNTEITGTVSNRSTDFDQIRDTFSEIIKSLYEIENLSSIEGGLESSNSTGSGLLSDFGIVYPPNLGGVNAKGYVMMPPATKGEYVFGGWNRCDSHKYGSKTLIGAIYTAALRWKAKYPQYTFRIGDLNAGPPHASHKNGVDVDIVTYGNWNLQINAPTEVNIDLGKAFIDTGVVKLIIFGGAVFNKNAPIVQNAWKIYANSKGLPIQTYALGNHDNHFHVRINDQFRGPVDAPGPCR